MTISESKSGQTILVLCEFVKLIKHLVEGPATAKSFYTVSGD